MKGRPVSRREIEFARSEIPAPEAEPSAGRWVVCPLSAKNSIVMKQEKMMMVKIFFMNFLQRIATTNSWHFSEIRRGWSMFESKTHRNDSSERHRSHHFLKKSYASTIPTGQ
jgi:hypothetical protein